MNNVKNIFSIKDLENLSGIKAHTIRIWEKRYGILTPLRTETNIRLYSLENLQKILNITLLHKHGYKISMISKLSEDRVPELVNEIISEKSVKSHAISTFKMAMIKFDAALFFSTYNKLLCEKPFTEVFYEVFIPLMEEIGLLWQTDTINIAHEHYIVFLIKQKLLTLTEKVQTKPATRTDKIFILFLPSNEIHELGLMFINYEILSRGYKTIYLGESVPVESLTKMKNIFQNITFICHTTVEPNCEEINDYVQNLKNQIMDGESKLWLIGKMAESINTKLISENVTKFKSIDELIALV